MVVIKELLQADILWGVGGEEIVDLLLGDREGLFKIHQSSLAATARPAPQIISGEIDVGQPLPEAIARSNTPRSGDISRDALNVGLVGATQLDHVPIGIAHEHRNAAVLAELYRSLRDGDFMDFKAAIVAGIEATPSATWV
jgi:hypothetical protein